MLFLSPRVKGIALGAALCTTVFGIEVAAIAHLPAPLRWVMILRERNGLSTREVVNLAGVSLKVIKSMQGRGLALTQEELLMRVRCGLVKERRP